MNLVEALGVEIGVRTAGSPEAARAAEAVGGALRELGLEPRFQEFDLVGYEPEEPKLEVEGERWDAGPCIYAHSTDGTVEGRVRYLGSSSSGEFFPKAHAFAIEDEESRELARLHASPFGGAAIPFVAGPRQIGIGPTAFISGPDANRLKEMEGARARVRIAGRFVPGCRERNVVAVQPGASEERIVVSAHFDSVWRGPGVIDNATGVEGMRRIAERLRGRELPRTAVFCAFAAEEIGLIGARHFVEEARVRNTLEQIKGVVNLDCIAHGERLEVAGSPPELVERARVFVAELALDRRYELEYGPASPGVDAYPFSECKIPAISVLHFPYDEYHLPAETKELVDEQKLSDSVALALKLVESQLAEPLPRSA